MENTNTGLSASTLKQLEERREKAVNGDVNCILSPFKRFRNDFFGIEQDTYYCITSFTKGKISLHLNTFNVLKT